MKSIYSFTVEKTEQVEEKTKESRKNKETGKEEEIEVSKKVEKKIPFEFLLKEPNRRQLEDADMEYSIEISRCVKKGILTKAMLAKKYSDSGGILTDKDAQRLVDLYGDLSGLGLPTKMGSIEQVANEEVLQDRILYGSDYPLLSFPVFSPLYHVFSLSPKKIYQLFKIKNRFDRDIALKKMLGISTESLERSAKFFK